MIIVEIGRGLGNSMYVYAAAKALAEHHKTELKLDTSFLRSWPRWEKYGGLWEFELGYFNISSKEAINKEIRKHVFKRGFRPIDKVVRKYKLFDRNVVYFPSYGSLKDFFSILDNTYLRGYLGREKFFLSIKDQIIKEFTLKEEHKNEIKGLLNEIEKNNSVSLHVRRGDVLTLKDSHVLNLDYYKKALKIMKDGLKNPVFYVFSDDIKWCKENLTSLDKNLIFVDNAPDTGYHTLELMKNCKHNILANSALSWWAGYLNRNKNKIVVAPAKFVHFQHAIVDEDTLPKEWIKI